MIVAEDAPPSRRDCLTTISAMRLLRTSIKSLFLRANLADGFVAYRRQALVFSRLCVKVSRKSAFALIRPSHPLSFQRASCLSPPGDPGAGRRRLGFRFLGLVAPGDWASRLPGGLMGGDARESQDSRGSRRGWRRRAPMIVRIFMSLRDPGSLWREHPARVRHENSLLLTPSKFLLGLIKKLLLCLVEGWLPGVVTFANRGCGSSARAWLAGRLPAMIAVWQKRRLITAPRCDCRDLPARRSESPWSVGALSRASRFCGWSN